MFPVPAAPLLHLLLETLGVIVAMAYYRHLRRAAPDPISDDRRFHLLIAAAAGAFIGSRLIGALEQPAYFLSGGGPAGLLYYFQSKTIVGGLLGGLFAVEATKRFVGIHHRSGDLYVYPLIVAMIIGRVGCFLMGVGEPTFGIPTTAITGLDLGDGMLRHPTALYEIALLLTFLWAGPRVQRHWKLRPGRLFMLFLTTYLLYRYTVGFIQPGSRVGGLTLIQWSCLLGLTWYIFDEWVSSSPTSPNKPHAGR